MASTTTFGDFPGVRVQTAGGAITGVVVGRMQKLVLFGEADTSDGAASPADPTQIRSRRDADTQFGSGSDLAQAMKDARANGASIDNLYGVAVERVEETETISGSGSGTLPNTPVIESVSAVSAAENTGSDDTYETDLTVNFVYTSPSTPSEEDTININPFSGEWAADSSGDYQIVYEHGDWQAALGAADGVIREDETGIYAVLSEAEEVASMLEGKVNTLRQEYQMVRGVAGAQPNASDSEGNAIIDTSSYSDAIDNDSMFLYGPARREGTTQTIGGAIAGLLAGNPVDDPVYNETLSGVTDLEQRLTKSEADDLRDSQVMPVRQMGSIRLRDNLSTATDDSWTRDFWRRRIVDQVILIAKQVGESIFGRINNEDTRSTAENLISVELRAMTRDGLIQPNSADEDNWYVEVYEDGTDQVGIDLGIAPYGIVKRVDVSLTVDA